MCKLKNTNIFRKNLLGKVKQIMLKSKNKLKEYFYIIPLLFLVLYHCFLSNNQNISLLQKVIILSVMILLSLFILNKKTPSKTHFASSNKIQVLKQNNHG